jgi:uncharacterized protein (DUF2249 family)
MAEQYKFPDEIDDDDKLAKGGNVEIDIEIEDDTPPEDRGREPMPKELVEELDKDELEEYSDKVKVRLKQMKKVWHDERRAKEAAYREQQEAVEYARRVVQENQQLKQRYAAGEVEYVATATNAAELRLDAAKKAYREAYDAGDGDKLVDAQQAMQEATYELREVKKFKAPALQREENAVQQQQVPQQQQVIQPDNRAKAWQERNSWFGQDEEMTASVLGLHEKLKRSGEMIVGSDEYYATLDKTIRRRFPENFESSETQTKTETSRTKPSTVVASATRSTSPNKVKLKTSQLQIAKKLGLTPEQYAREQIKLEAQ